MPQILPIEFIENSGKISEMVHSSSEPIFLTKDGYSDVVIMSNDAYEARNEAYINLMCERLDHSNSQYKNGEGIPLDNALSSLRSKYGI